MRRPHLNWEPLIARRPYILTFDGDRVRDIDIIKIEILFYINKIINIFHYDVSGSIQHHKFSNNLRTSVMSTIEIQVTHADRR